MLCTVKVMEQPPSRLECKYKFQHCWCSWGICVGPNPVYGLGQIVVVVVLQGLFGALLFTLTWKERESLHPCWNW